jgi:hypothetical protein
MAILEAKANQVFNPWNYQVVQLNQDVTEAKLRNHQGVQQRSFATLDVHQDKRPGSTPKAARERLSVAKSADCQSLSHFVKTYKLLH